MKKIEDLTVVFRGRRYATWRYDQVPPGMKLATRRDIFLGRQILFQVILGSDAGKYYSGVVTESNRDAVYARIEDGRYPVYVKESSIMNK